MSPALAVRGDHRRGELRYATVGEWRLKRRPSNVCVSNPSICTIDRGVIKVLGETDFEYPADGGTFFVGLGARHPWLHVVYSLSCLGRRRLSNANNMIRPASHMQVSRPWCQTQDR